MGSIGHEGWLSGREREAGDNGLRKGGGSNVGGEMG